MPKSEKKSSSLVREDSTVNPKIIKELEESLSELSTSEASRLIPSTSLTAKFTFKTTKTKVENPHNGDKLPIKSILRAPGLITPEKCVTFNETPEIREFQVIEAGIFSWSSSPTHFTKTTTISIHNEDTYISGTSSILLDQQANSNSLNTVNSLASDFARLQITDDIMIDNNQEAASATNSLISELSSSTNSFNQPEIDLSKSVSSTLESEVNDIKVAIDQPTFTRINYEPIFINTPNAFVAKTISVKSYTIDKQDSFANTARITSAINDNLEDTFVNTMHSISNCESLCEAVYISDSSDSEASIIVSHL